MTHMDQVGLASPDLLGNIGGLGQAKVCRVVSLAETVKRQVLHPSQLVEAVRRDRIDIGDISKGVESEAKDWQLAVEDHNRLEVQRPDAEIPLDRVQFNLRDPGVFVRREQVPEGDPQLS